MIAKLIGERSAGMTAVEIYNNDGDLVWSHRYFDAGATHQGYINGLCQVWDDMRACADVSDYDGGLVDDDDNPVLLDDGDTTGIMIEYDSDSNTWTLGDGARSLGQSDEIIDACMIAGLLDPDDKRKLNAEYDYQDSDTVKAIAQHIKR